MCIGSKNQDLEIQKLGQFPEKHNRQIQIRRQYPEIQSPQGIQLHQGETITARIVHTDVLISNHLDTLLLRSNE